LIVHESRTPQINVLKGLISGVGVLKEMSLIAARPIVGLRRHRELADWKAALGTELGYIPPGKVPQLALKELTGEKITVRI
jgi:hypothetical protein